MIGEEELRRSFNKSGRRCLIVAAKLLINVNRFANINKISLMVSNK